MSLIVTPRFSQGSAPEREQQLLLKIRFFVSAWNGHYSLTSLTHRYSVGNQYMLADFFKLLELKEPCVVS